MASAVAGGCTVVHNMHTIVDHPITKLTSCPPVLSYLLYLFGTFANVLITLEDLWGILLGSIMEIFYYRVIYSDQRN